MSPADTAALLALLERIAAASERQAQASEAAAQAIADCAQNVTGLNFAIQDFARAF